MPSAATEVTPQGSQQLTGQIFHSGWQVGWTDRQVMPSRDSSSPLPPQPIPAACGGGSQQSGAVSSPLRHYLAIPGTGDTEEV